MKLSSAPVKAAAVIVSLLLPLLIGEVVLRIKNSSMQNYDIEMWRYSIGLKRPSDNPVLGHEHAPNSQAVLQNVNIRLNEWGMRGGPVPGETGKRRIVFIGGSVTLGWGVEEDKTVEERIRQMFAKDGDDVEVFNSGVANYNTARYVELFITRLNKLKPTDVVALCFVRDAEILEAGSANFLMRNSQLAVTIWSVIKQNTGPAGFDSLEAYYRSVFNPEREGFKSMKTAFKRLAGYAKENHVRLYLGLIPETHDLVNYRFQFTDEEFEKIAKENGYTFVNFYQAFKGLTPGQIWATKVDAHPNELGHKLMAEALYPVLKAPAGGNANAGAEGVAK
ncbi:MAG: hypothetical protein HZB29_01280 [Nitrospinae bacterium]|nr:hypothetical protein [Nitrospinota bacterium]